MTETDFIKFKHESYIRSLKNFAETKQPFNQIYLFFGGTGAVGGQAVIELIQAYEYVLGISSSQNKNAPTLVLTGRFESEIETFRTKLNKVFTSKKNKIPFETVKNENSSANLILKRKSGIQLEFHLLNASPSFKTDLNKIISSKNSSEKNIKILQKEASKITAPFEEFVEKYKKENQLSKEFKLRAVVSGIPIPSVATYHFGAIDKILEDLGIAENDLDKNIERSIKIEILRGLSQDFGNIKAKHSEEVLIAHTTAVGGMYQIVDGQAVIKLGYAHSSLGDLLKEKQFYANQLTIQYSKFKLKSLVTAAAIGIDYIYDTGNLPMSSGIARKMIYAKEDKKLPFPEKLMKPAADNRLYNRIFPSLTINAFHPILNEKDEPVGKEKLTFIKENQNAPMLKIKYALRSGENGLFSLDNAWALYLNMKIATQEELAHVLVYGALFGDDKQKPFFDSEGICYYTQTDNSMLVFSLLGNRAAFRAYQTSAFTAKAFQELGSSKHQAELHTIGLYMLLHRLKSLDADLIYKNVTSKYTDSEVMEFVDRNTKPLLLEDIIEYNSEEKAQEFASLFNLESPEELAAFMNYKGDIQKGFIKTFFKNLLSVVKQSIETITSLGTPIVYLDKDGKEKILAGPYLAPADLLLNENTSLVNFIEDQAKKYHLDAHKYYNWLICNNGFVDLRPGATIVTAKSPHLLNQRGKLKNCKDFEAFKEAILDVPSDEYFTSSGILAFVGRIKGLHNQLSSFDISLGTFNAWKALFPVDYNDCHVVIPGIIEAMRMYTEGLGKVTGTEMLYPGHGYFNE